MLRTCLVLVLALGCGSKAPKTASNTGSTPDSATGSAAGSAETDCGGAGTCIALCEGKQPKDPACDADCKKQFPSCYSDN